MKILVDENIPRVTVDFLRNSGHDVRDVRGTVHQGLDDPDLWAVALTEAPFLITTDRGFTEHRGRPHHGILIVRLHQPNRLRIHNAVLLALSRFRPEDWTGTLVVVRDNTLSVSRHGGSVEQL